MRLILNSILRDKSTPTRSRWKVGWAGLPPRQAITPVAAVRVRVRMEIASVTAHFQPTEALIDLPYRIPSSETAFQEVIRRSRFVTYLAPANEEEGARAFIEDIRQRHPGATHHCWAYNLGPPGDTARVGMSDDGEPKGTAGRPMLAALLHSEVGEVVAVCARYYGGTKLGTGGLARAYGGGVREALDQVPTQVRRETVGISIQVDYAYSDVVERLLDRDEVQIEDRSYGQSVRFRCRVDAGHFEALKVALADATRGSAGIQLLDGADE